MLDLLPERVCDDDRDDYWPQPRQREQPHAKQLGRAGRTHDPASRSGCCLGPSEYTERLGELRQLRYERQAD
jgi:hypothetical protein